jgi:RNA polymerase sigma-70 factor (ECF subfamily)
MATTPEDVLDDAATWLDDHGDCLFRYAIRHTRGGEAAEELVQETLLAALAGHRTFAGRSHVRTWLIGILKHKIADWLRQRKRSDAGASDAAMSEEALDRWVDGQFTRRGIWKSKVGNAPEDPAGETEWRELSAVLADCVEKLPARSGEILLAAERDEKSSAELSKVFELSTTNIGVILHRARMALRRCLELNWFGAERGRR